MLKRGSLSCFVLAVIGLAALPGRAQQADTTNHAAHHPGEPPTESQVAPGAAPASRAASSSEAEDCCGSDQYREPLYPRLMGLGPGDKQGRQALIAQAEHRMLIAATEIGSATAALSSSRGDAERRATLERLRDATAEYQSAAGVVRALQSGSHSQAVGLDWLRGAMNLESPQHSDERLFGLGALHLWLMVLVGLAAIGLLGLQFRRQQRARVLLSSAIAPRVEAVAPADSEAALPRAIMTAPPGPAAQPKRWSGRLRVAHIAQETPTVETYRLVPLDGDVLPFDFLPGQFLQVEVEPEPGKTSRRSYTIASSPTQRAFVEITVKREERGAVSKFMNEKLAVGDLLQIAGPFGAFTFTGSDADSIVLIAGGVGITPVMSVLRYLTDRAWPGEIFLLYGARSTEEFVFREEIERLERRHANLHVLAAMQRTPGTVWLGPEGNLTKELVAGAVPAIAERRVHLCGPPPMMAAVRQILLDLGVADAQIHTEAFGPASLPAENAPAAVTAPTSHGPVQAPPSAANIPTAVAETTVTFSVSGVAAPLSANETVLEAAEAAGVEIPYSCRVGECGVCVTRLQQGTVTMAVESGLDPADKAQGYVLACQAKTTGGPLVVEA